MFKKFSLVLLITAFLFQSIPVFAFEHHGGPRPNFPKAGGFRGVPVHRLPPGYVSLMVGGLNLLYCAGLFYEYTPAGYVIVQPPAGAVVPVLPTGYTTVFVNSTPYYYYGYTYYTPVAGGYAVATPPAAVTAPAAVPTTAAPVQAVVPVASQQSAAPIPTASLGAPASTPHSALYDNPKAETNRDVYEIYIPNGNGSYTSVTLRKTEKGFLGPQGEFYSDHPTIEQLRERYTKK